MDYVIYFVITIGILVFIHEFGHFIAAKAFKMRVDVFAIGFGKRLFGWNKLTGFTFGELAKDFDGLGNTDYRLSLLPLGGYVKIAGMVDESFDTKFASEEPKPYEFRARPTYQKIIVITAGVMMNLLLALMIFWGANFFNGKQITKTTTVGYVVPNSVADSLGFLPNDKIVSINGKQVDTWGDLRSQIFIYTAGVDLDIKVQRDSNLIDLKAPRARIPASEETDYFLIPFGIKPAVAMVLDKSPAEKAGLKENDVFLKLNGVELYSPSQTTKIFSLNKNVELPLVIQRDKDTLTVAVTPGSDGMIGIQITQVFTGLVEYEKYGFFASFYQGWQDIVRMTDLTFNMFGKVVDGDVAFGKVFGGPVKIAQFAAKSANDGISSFLVFLALLSLSLAILNILPFPVLDGGHLIIIIIEGIIRKEIPIKIKMAIQNTGFAILLILMAYIIYSDILNL
ncbi:MAG: RIP metalloprotease RseP [Ignavibacteriales bacterium CG_4_9_14_3_um_filter_30_11]|nr:MAG: RIP metalloprotease RseP [Ignavibacteriales bacterium CG_4_9_14_3_um_filter_30_11]